MSPGKFLQNFCSLNPCSHQYFFVLSNILGSLNQIIATTQASKRRFEKITVLTNNLVIVKILIRLSHSFCYSELMNITRQLRVLFRISKNVIDLYMVCFLFDTILGEVSPNFTPFFIYWISERCLYWILLESNVSNNRYQGLQSF